MALYAIGQTGHEQVLPLLISYLEGQTEGSTRQLRKVALWSLSNITKRPEGNLSQLSGAAFSLSLQVADEKGENLFMSSLTNGIESHFLLNCGLSILQFLDKVWDVLLSDFLVVVGAHLTKKFLWLMNLLRFDTSIADKLGKNQAGRSLEPESLPDSLRFDQLVDLMDDLLRWNLGIMRKAGNNQEAFKFIKLLLLNHLLQEHNG